MKTKLSILVSLIAIFVLTSISLVGQQSDLLPSNIVFTDNTNVRDKPSLKSNVVGQLSQNYIISIANDKKLVSDVIGKKEGYWVPILYNNAVSYIWSGVLSEMPIECQIDNKSILIHYSKNKNLLSFKVFKEGTDSLFLEKGYIIKGKESIVTAISLGIDKRGGERISVLFDDNTYESFAWYESHFFSINKNLKPLRNDRINMGLYGDVKSIKMISYDTINKEMKKSIYSGYFNKSGNIISEQKKVRVYNNGKYHYEYKSEYMFKYKYTYDKNRNIIKITGIGHRSESKRKYSNIIKYTYDNKNNLIESIKRKYSDGDDYAYIAEHEKYDEFGNITFFGTYWAQEDYKKYYFYYDKKGRMIRKEFKTEGGDIEAPLTTYKFDDVNETITVFTTLVYPEIRDTTYVKKTHPYFQYENGGWIETTKMSKYSFPKKKIIFDKKRNIISGFSESFFIEIELEYY